MGIPPNIQHPPLWKERGLVPAKWRRGPVYHTNTQTHTHTYTCGGTKRKDQCCLSRIKWAQDHLVRPKSNINTTKQNESIATVQMPDGWVPFYIDTMGTARECLESFACSNEGNHLAPMACKGSRLHPNNPGGLSLQRIR